MKSKTALDKAINDWYEATNPAGEKYAEFWGKILEEYGFKKLDNQYNIGWTFYKHKDVIFSLEVVPPKKSVQFSGAINNDNSQAFKEKFKNDFKLRGFLEEHFGKKS